MAFAIAAYTTLENSSIKNQNATSIDRFTDAFMRCVYRSSLSIAFVTTVSDFSFGIFLYIFDDTDWLASWN